MAESILKTSRNALIPALWPSDSSPLSKTWVILDCARDERLYGAVERTRQNKCCLYAGVLSQPLKVVAPYLVELEPGDRFTDYVLDNGWGNAWGVFVRSNASMEMLRRHFRKFLRVSDAGGRTLLFRYYDPRVLRVYLPTCNPEELTLLFDAVERFMVESEDGAKVIEYRFTGRKLIKTEFPSV